MKDLLFNPFTIILNQHKRTTTNTRYHVEALMYILPATRAEALLHDKYIEYIVKQLHDE